MRSFPTVLAAGIVALWALSLDRHDAAAAADAKPPRPNILLMIGDDHTWRDCRCYGNADVRTPNIDKLAAQGMRLTSAFTATAMCSPTRQQLYTGIFPVRNGAYPNHSQVKPGIKSLVHYFKDLGYRVGLSGKTHIGPRAAFPFEMAHDIPKFINRDKAQPYFLVVASKHPHMPWPDKPAGYEPAKLTVPPCLVDNPETRLALARYYSEVTKLDGEVGEAMNAVEQSGDAKNTIFIYTSEQGSPLPFAKWTCYDLGLKTAMLVRWPGRIRPGSVSDAMVQYVDVVPSLVEAAGGKVPEGLDGKSFLRVLEGKADSHNEYVFGVHTTAGIIAGKPYPIRSIRSKTHKYILNLMPEASFNNVVTRMSKDGVWNSWVRDAASNPFAAERVKMYQHRPAEEFYDLASDPYELHNLADKPQHRAQMDAMRRKLETWMKQQGDRGVETELAVKAARQKAKNGGGEE